MSFNDLEFGRGIIKFKKIRGDQILDSSLDMGDNYILTIKGKITETSAARSLSNSAATEFRAARPKVGFTITKHTLLQP
jgi:hypothetical protein